MPWPQLPTALRKARRSLALLIALILLAFPMSGAALSEPTDTQPAQAAPFTSGAVWVKLDSVAQAAAIKGRDWGSYAVSDVARGTAWVRLDVAPGQEVATAQQLSRRPDVRAAEPEYVISAAEAPNDPSYPSQWNMNKIGMPLAWDMRTANTNVVVAVVDTGVDMNHVELQGNIWQNFGEVANNGLDDDGNGFVDDRWGWDFFNGDPTPSDDNGHGTHVAGIIGALGNNGTGVAGMLWRARIMAVKVLDGSGNGTYAGVAEGVRYAAENGARIVNLSLAGTSSSQILQDAINEAYQQYGVLVIAAAGNCGSTACDGQINPIMYPAAMERVLSVAATDSSDKRASISEYNAFVDLAAPGVSVYSTIPGNRYQYKTGTSMATPHVSGLAALIWALRPAWTADEVEAQLRATADQVGTEPYVAGRNDYFGSGRIDAAAALWSLDAPRVSASRDRVMLCADSGMPMTATAVLTSSSIGVTRWTATAEPDDGWLTISPSSGILSATSPLTLTLGVDGGALPGYHVASVRLSSDNPFVVGSLPEIEVHLLTALQLHRVRLPVVHQGTP